jgi:GTPase
MSLPVVAIVGRTNVGKSALFNRLVGERLAVVEDFPGVTRDRLYAQVELGDRQVILVDTGGLVGAENDELIVRVKEQAARALQEADVLLLVTDGREGVTALDHEVAEVVRRSGKPCVLAANKMELKRLDSTEFADLRLGMPIDTSATRAMGVPEMVDAILDLLPPADDEVEEERLEGEIRVAMVGRPNVGKSAIINALLGEERVIVSDVPGTTRDAVDILATIDGVPYRLIDTAGLRRKSKFAAPTEYYSSLRTLKAVSRADIALVVMDALEGLTSQDSRVAGEVLETGRGVLLVANKWDLVLDASFADESLAKQRKERIERTIRRDFESIARDQLPFLAYANIAYTSAVTGMGVGELLPMAGKISAQFHRRIETGPLNRVIQRALLEHPPPTRKGKQLKIYYVTQAESAPPVFIFFVNSPELLHFSYERYLTNSMRKAFGFEGVPLKLVFKARESLRDRKPR